MPNLMNAKTPEQQKQMDVARNISHLRSKQAKRQQAHMLCLAMIRMIRGK